MKSLVKNYRQSPRKVRLVARLVSGKMVDDAQRILEFTPKRSAPAISKAIKSAVANAVNNFSMNQSDLLVESISVDEGTKMKRFRPKFGGRADRIQKRSSHVTVTLKKIEAKKIKNK